MKINRYVSLAAASLFLLTLGTSSLSCSKAETGFKWQDEWNEPAPGPNPEPEPEPEPELPVLPEKPLSALADPTGIGWEDVTADYKIGADIKVYRFTNKFFGRPAIAYIAVAEASRAGFSIWSINDPQLQGTSDSFRTPSLVHESSGADVIVNGGYFYSSSGTNYSASLAVSDGVVMGQNINYASEDWKTMYYPTRAAFVEHTGGSFESCWTYYTSAGKCHLYQNPAKNSWKNKPLQTPSATFPETAAELDAKNAIGGGPVLLKNSEIVNSYVAELFDGASGIGPDIYAPRTAVGISSDSKLVLFVCEGRQMTEGVTGLTTGEVAKVLYSLGCKDAINLDGGGSSCMLVGGRETIKVSDGSQRPVASCVMFK